VELVPGFTVLLQPFAMTMTAPTFERFVTLAAGWVLSSLRTVTRMIVAAGDTASKHYSSYHRVFSAARWSLDGIGLAVFDLISPWIDGQVLLAVDDTLARKRGLKMFGCGMHHERTAPVAMLLYSLVVLWFAQEGHRRDQSLDCPWYAYKAEPSIADMLATLRFRRHVLSLAVRGSGSRKLKQLLENTLANAA
jgi:hypothetical protein